MILQDHPLKILYFNGFSLQLASAPLPPLDSQLLVRLFRHHYQTVMMMMIMTFVLLESSGFQQYDLTQINPRIINLRKKLISLVRYNSPRLR